jgi:ankyrin repeat protein
MLGLTNVVNYFSSAETKIERICKESGDVNHLKRILNRNSQLDIKTLFFDDGEFHAIHLAAISDFPAIIDYLVTEKGVNQSIKSHQAGTTVLHLASWGGCIDVVQFLCEKLVVNINEVSNDGFTALHYACWGDMIEIARYLVKFGCNRAMKSKNGYTAFHLAARCANLSIVEYFLDEELVNLDAVDDDGCTALHHACYEGHIDLVRLLIKHGADITLKDKTNRTAMDLSKTREIAELLGGIRVQTADKTKRTFKLPLRKQPTSGDIIKGSTEEKEDVDDATSVLQKFLDKSKKEAIDLKEKVYKGQRTLALAQEDSEELSESYLSKLPAAPSPSKNGSSPGKMKLQQQQQQPTFKEGEHDVIAGVGITIAPKVAQECWRLCGEEGGDIKAFKRLLTAYPSLLQGQPSPLSYLRDSESWTLLARAASHGYEDLVKLLVSIDPDSVNNADDHGFTALHRACIAGQTDIVALFLAIVDPKKDDLPVARVDEATKKGITPLHKACEFGHTDIVKSLIMRGADENNRDKDGYTPLHYACLNSYRDIIAFLILQCNPNPLIMSIEGELPEDLTRSSRIKKVLQTYTVHRSKADTEVEYSKESAEIWKHVETCIQDLYKQSPHKTADSHNSYRHEQGLGQGGRRSPSPSPERLQEKQSSLFARRENKERHGSPSLAIGPSLASNMFNRYTENNSRQTSIDHKSNAWKLIQNAQKASKLRVKQNDIILLQGGGIVRDRDDVNTSFEDIDVMEFEQKNDHHHYIHNSSMEDKAASSASPALSMISTTSNTKEKLHPLHPDENPADHLRERLKEKYRTLEHNLYKGSNDKDAKVDLSEMDNSDDDSLNLASTPQRSLEDIREQQKEGETNKNVAVSLFSLGDEDEEEGKEDEQKLVDTYNARKEMKGSLLLTMILTQVYNVYSNKISRAFYRWKHRSGVASNTPQRKAKRGTL